jgi:hypothetical protein
VSTECGPSAIASQLKMAVWKCRFIGGIIWSDQMQTTDMTNLHDKPNQAYNPARAIARWETEGGAMQKVKTPMKQETRTVREAVAVFDRSHVGLTVSTVTLKMFSYCRTKSLVEW